MFINKLKTKFYSFFFFFGFKYTKNSQLFLKKFPSKSETNAFESSICRQENAAAVRSLRAEIVIVGNSKFGEGKWRNESVEWHVAWLAE